MRREGFGGVRISHGPLSEAFEEGAGGKFNKTVGGDGKHYEQQGRQEIYQGSGRRVRQGGSFYEWRELTCEDEE